MSDLMVLNERTMLHANSDREHVRPHLEGERVVPLGDGEDEGGVLGDEDVVVVYADTLPKDS